MIRVDHTRGSIRSKVAPSAIAGIVAIGISLVAGVLPASSATATGKGPSISLSDRTITPGGGTITVTATPAEDSTCSVSVTPALPTLPEPVSCDGGWPIQFDLDVPGNPTGKVVDYTVSVSSCGQNKPCLKSAKVSFTQWAYKLALTSTPLTNDFVDMACPSTTFCLALDSTGGGHLVSAIRGKVKDVKMDPTGRLLSTVACGSTTNCVAADLQGDVAVFNAHGSNWTIRTAVGDVSGAVSVFADCPLTDDCYVDWSAGLGSAQGDKGAPAVLTEKVKLRQGVKVESAKFVTPAMTTGFACLRGTDTCALSGGDASLSTIAGGVMTTYSSKGPTFGDLVCPSASSCLGPDVSGGIADVAPLQVSTTGIFHSELDAPVEKLACPKSWLCAVSSPKGIALVELARKKVVKFVTIASVWCVPSNDEARVISAIPGELGQIVAISSKAYYVGHVTLIK